MMSNIKKYFSRKLAKISSFDYFVKATNEVEEKSKDMLIIHTANGLYQGQLKPTENFSNNEITEGEDILTCIRKLYLSSLEDYYSNDSSNIDLQENPLTIELENVTLFTSGKDVSMPFVSIFIDQIIGISLGHIGSVN